MRAHTANQQLQDQHCLKLRETDLSLLWEKKSQLMITETQSETIRAQWSSLLTK